MLYSMHVFRLVTKRTTVPNLRYFGHLFGGFQGQTAPCPRPAICSLQPTSCQTLDQSPSCCRAAAWPAWDSSLSCTKRWGCHCRANLFSCPSWPSRQEALHYVAEPSVAYLDKPWFLLPLNSFTSSGKRLWNLLLLIKEPLQNYNSGIVR